MTVIRYEVPKNWISYDGLALANVLAEAKAAALSLRTIPYQRRWVDALQQIELKREVAGTSRIEGAVFTDRELDAAMKESAEQLHTRSQRQAHAVVQTYRWLAKLPDDLPINSDLVCGIHRRIVEGADDDHCPPGRLRRRDENVNFGAPRHRGTEGGEECEESFGAFTNTIQREYQEHDPIIQALAAHYHLAAMHPFLDGNGRTARALEALMLRRAGFRDTSFISMSNYYYDEKNAYLSVLAQVRQNGHDLTPFLLFALKGITVQARRLLNEIQLQISKELFRSLAIELFGRLKTPRKKVIAQRQLEILNLLLNEGALELSALMQKMQSQSRNLKNPSKAVIRDLATLLSLKAIKISEGEDAHTIIGVRLEWPTEITETDFFRRLKTLPKAKTLSFLR